MKILFFGRLSDEVGQREWRYDSAGSTLSFDDLLAELQSELGEQARQAVSAKDITVAVDQTVVADVTGVVLEAGSEIAFFPPVTGG